LHSFKQCCVCALEILDEITRLAFHSQLVPEINGYCRNTLIRQFHTWKGLNYVPETLHPTIKWSAQHPNPLKANVQNIPWQIVNRKEILNSKLNNSMIKASNAFTAAKGSVPLLYNIITPTSSKHKPDDQNEPHTIKKLKMNQTDQRKNTN
jgi:hypothetical protein